MLKPLGHRVLVRVDVEKKTGGGIVLVQNTKMEAAASEVATVVAIGPNAWKAFDDGQPWCKVGDKIVISKFGGKIVVDPNAPEADDDNVASRYIVLNDEDCLCLAE